MKPVQFTYAWNRPFWPEAGVEKEYLLLEMKGIGDKKVKERAPLNLCLVLDRSGSMSGNPLEYSKKACQFVVDQMNEGDMLSMVTFEDEVSTVFEPQFAERKSELKRRIQTIQPGGCTNISGGLLKGLQYVAMNKREGYVNRVILLSDGQANRGIIEPEKLGSIAKEYVTAGIGVTTMGVGENFDEEVLEAISENGGGNFYYIDKAERIPFIFHKELEGLLTVLAQNLQLQLTPEPHVCIMNIYGIPAGDSNKLTFQLGDLYHHEVKSLLIEISSTRQSAGIHRVLGAALQYMDVTGTVQAVEENMDIQAHYTQNVDLLDQPANPYVDQQVQITKSAEAIERAMHAFDSGELNEGQEILKHQADALLAQAILTDNVVLREESQLLYEKLENFEYSAGMRKELHAQKYRSRRRG
ncbi:vWA domain-containing protein [Paenibacillus swuensis]|uniref:vWA domain-containing protein n=1 Tax=Paenibacillus swuensis TaxID=1178515 RepID=UPI00083991A5|nr:VWA domain-containing protein [Paenibacillus swuensis]